MNDKLGNTEICCEDGHIVKRTSGQANACCGSETLDTRWQSCCAGRVVDSPGLGCCGTVFYSKHNATCCKGVLKEGLGSVLAQCCGTEAFDSHLFMCCKGKLWLRQEGLECCGKDWYNPSTHLCLVEELQPRQSASHVLCGRDQYHPAHNSCCNGVIQGKKEPCLSPTSSSQMCGTVRYSSSELVCCSGRLLPRQKGWTCCGDALFNPRTHECFGEIREKGKQRTLRPCGRNSFFDPTFERCCVNGSSLGQRYGPGHTCCKGTLHQTSGTGLYGGQCCDGKGFNPETHFCCNGEVNDQSEWQRIGDNDFLEYSLDRICCAGRRFPAWGGERDCHGGLPFNQHNQTVCGSTVHNVTRGTCCGDSLYDPSTQVCCSGHSQIRPPWAWVECCGTQLYNTSDPLQLCCGSRLHHLPHHDHGNHRCCGDAIINILTHDCCSTPSQQVAHPKEPHMACCGHRPYNSTQEHCCAGTLYPAGPTHLPHIECPVIHVKDLYLQTPCNHGGVLVGRVETVLQNENYTVYTLRKYLQWKRPSGLWKSSETQEPWVKFRLHNCSCPVLTPLQDYAIWLPKSPQGSSLPPVPELISPLHVTTDMSYVLRLLIACQQEKGNPHL
ncbi:hypothetical protein AGOR_G00031340 [Albula goreensis]|uniref:Galaxin-like repeats domain-containing protein n=1 Tax=Albula goreensis TaxID=1534307 RepID=A0A8T3EA51_9TELE|nr:hypothetical protein AGOR_G00031340 [Albula goreensis]